MEAILTLQGVYSTPFSYAPQQGQLVMELTNVECCGVSETDRPCCVLHPIHNQSITTQLPCRRNHMILHSN